MGCLVPLHRSLHYNPTFHIYGEDRGIQDTYTPSASRFSLEFACTHFSAWLCCDLNRFPILHVPICSTLGLLPPCCNQPRWWRWQQFVLRKYSPSLNFKLPIPNSVHGFQHKQTLQTAPLLQLLVHTQPALTIRCEHLHSPLKRQLYHLPCWDRNFCYTGVQTCNSNHSCYQLFDHIWFWTYCSMVCLHMVEVPQWCEHFKGVTTWDKGVTTNSCVDGSEKYGFENSD